VPFTPGLAEEIQGAMGDQKIGQLLESHLIPSASDSPLFQDDFDNFLTQRQKLITEEIEKVTG